MARLKVADPPQHGYRTGGATTAPAAAGASAPTPESPPRRRAPKPSIKKKRVSLTPNRQATLAVEYAGLPKPKAERNRALDGLCRKYGCNSHYPRQMVSGLSLNGKLPPSRKGKAGRNPRITVRSRRRPASQADPSRERLRPDVSAGGGEDWLPQEHGAALDEEEQVAGRRQVHPPHPDRHEHRPAQGVGAGAPQSTTTGTSLGRHRREVVLRVFALGQAQAAAGRREAQAEDQVEALHRQGDDALHHCQAV